MICRGHWIELNSPPFAFTADHAGHQISSLVADDLVWVAKAVKQAFFESGDHHRSTEAWSGHKYWIPREKINNDQNVPHDFILSQVPKRIREINAHYFKWAAWESPLNRRLGIWRTILALADWT
jgi:hypothetical protein